MVSRIPNDIFQFSLPSAFDAGLNSSGPQSGQLTGYGSHGIGLFANNGGDLLFLDSVAWQIGSDCSVKRADHYTSLPLVQVTRYLPEAELVLDEGSVMGGLVERMAKAGHGGQNSFMPFRLRGKFASVSVGGSAGRTLEDVEGVMFGLMSPVWAQGFSVVGANAVFMTSGKNSLGGRVKAFKTAGACKLDWAVTGRYHLGMPSGQEWEGLTLGSDGVSGKA